MSEVIFTPTLAEAFALVGMTYPADLEPGCIHRFPSSGKQNDWAGWCRVFDDGDGAAFGSWRDDSSFVWQRKKGEGVLLLSSDIAALKVKASQERQQSEMERDERYRQAGKEASQKWSAATQAIQHPYLNIKKIQSHGVRISGDALIVPVHDSDGSIQTLQYIMSDGTKKFMSGGKVAGGRYWLGIPTNAGPLVVCEGFATAAVIQEATGYATVCAFNAGNLQAVARDIRRQFPIAQLLIAGDDDRSTPGNPGRTKAEAAAQAASGKAVFPDLSTQGTDFWDMSEQQGAEAVVRLINAALSSHKFKLLTGADVRALPVPQWRIKGVLPAQGLAALYGPSASGKSFLALDMAAAIACGRTWFGHKVSPAPAVYVALEGEAGFKLRVQAWERHHEQSLPNDLQIVLQPFKLEADVDDLAKVIPKGAVVFIDTLNRAAPTADENSSKDMGAILEQAKRLQALTAGLVIVVHHTGKDIARGLRGHSSLFAALDAAIVVSRNSDSREWLIAKSKDGVDGGTYPFRLLVVPLGVDEDGDPLTSCVITVNTKADDIQNAKVPQGKNQRLVLDAIRTMLREMSPVVHPTVPPGCPSLELDAVLPQLSACLSVAPDKRTSRTREAISGLVERGVVCFENGRIWIK